MPLRNGQHQVVIVGGGIVGSSIAVHLLGHGIRPVLIDPDRAGDSASALSFGSITAFDAGLDGHATNYYDLARAGMAGWPRFARRLGGAGDAGYRRGGQIRWAAEPTDGQALITQVARAAGRGYPVRTIGHDELCRLLPAARPGPISAACHAPEDACVEPAAVLGACRAILEEAGARLLLGAKARVGVTGTRVRVEVGDEVLWPSVTVLAAGAATATMAAALGLDVDLTASPGMLVATAPVAPLTGAVVYLPGDAPGRPPVHLRQRPDGSVLVGERSQETVTGDPSRRHARTLVAQAAHFLPPLAAARVERRTVGWRSIPADRLPVVGPAAGLPSVYLAVTPGAVTLAPALGRLVARELADGVSEPSLEPFRPRPRRHSGALDRVGP